ncbi:MAG: LPS export ABC transporter periplasmic protein LptC [Candidatus Omnitrophica bacterium]|nr:LPS export ABC transporter periplasmic protein LptC [Candidatus Omnitrophota bacterium]MDD5355376.1 LPS export ABC transporter periplasmic protein LptC [Candidatus Omnitrophota bacterium]
MASRFFSKIKGFNKFLLSVFVTSVLLIMLSGIVVAEEEFDESDQKILGFSLSNFGEKNEKTWDLKGDTLEVFGNLIQLTNITANLYGKEEDMVLTADTGSFDRGEGKVHLQDNVLITSESGAKMMTQTLDWFQKNQLVTTNDKVNISKGSVDIEGVGAVGQTDLKQVSLNKEVEVNITSEEDDAEGKSKLRKTTITCDGILDVDYQAQIAIFNDNVKADDGESELYADKMTAYFDKDTKKIMKVVCEGNVKIVRGQDTSYSEKAIYDAATQKISLVGSPKIVFYSDESISDIQ